MSRKMFALVLLALLGSLFTFAQQKFTTFSFASDDTHNSPTFIFTTPNVIQALAEINLMVDVNADNFGGQITWQTRFIFRGETYDYNVFPCGANFLHVWKVKGEATFDHADPTAPGNRLLTIRFEQATLTSISPSPSRVGQTLTLQDAEGVDPGIQILSSTILVGAGVDPSELVTTEDFAFTYTRARDFLGAQFIPLDNMGNWLSTFASESSFSASGNP